MRHFTVATFVALYAVIAAGSLAMAQGKPAPAPAKKAPEASADASAPITTPTLSKLLSAGFTVANVSFVNVANGEMTFVVWLQAKSKLYACPVVSSVGGASLGDIQVRNKAADNACTPMH